MIYGIQYLKGKTTVVKLSSLAQGRNWRDRERMNPQSGNFEVLAGDRTLLESPKWWRFPIEKRLTGRSAADLLRKICTPVNPRSLRREPE